MTKQVCCQSDLPAGQLPTNGAPTKHVRVNGELCPASHALGNRRPVFLRTNSARRILLSREYAGSYEGPMGEHELHAPHYQGWADPDAGDVAPFTSLA